MRTEFSGAFNKDQLLNDLNISIPYPVEIKLTERRKRNIIILATKEHHCLSDLLLRHKFNELDANLMCVISNYANLEELTAKFQIPFHYVSHEGKDREKHEQEILTIINRYSPEFLPAFVGASPYAQAYDRGVKIIGATAHFVNNNLDEGPIIAQSVIPVAHTHSAKEMALAGKDVEKIVLARALKLVLEERVFVYRNKTIIFD
jgi:formyltetrahydrofolate deformylase